MADLPLGIDVSSHQGVMDFGVLAKREPKISFMAARFGWHDDFVDPRKELLRKYYDMPEGEMKFRQEGQEVVMFVEERGADEADH
jgi:hypothetical protein